MNIEKIKITDLVLDDNNARMHSRKNLDAIKGSLSKFGQQKPIVIDNQNKVIAGNGTVAAALELGLEFINCVRSELVGNKAMAYALADNRTAELAEWNDDVLNASLSELKNQNFDLHSIGFGDFQEPEKDGLTDGDDIPENVEPRTKLGDLWKLGNHRLLCGDSTKAEDVERLMGGMVPNIMMTDPPYGVKLDMSWREKANNQNYSNKNTIKNDDIADWFKTYLLFKGNVAYVWHASSFVSIVEKNLKDAGFLFCQQLIWNKSSLVFGRSDYHWKHEPCFYVVREGKSHSWIGDRKQTTVIEASSPNNPASNKKEEDDYSEHPSQKPLACMMMIKNHSGDVYDPFLGSGTTLIASEKVNKKCFGMELDPKYCDIIIKRWEDFTGQKAELL